MAFNANYLLDILRHIDTDKIKFVVNDSDGPGLVYPNEQDKAEELVMLIMPVRLSS